MFISYAPVKILSCFLIQTNDRQAVCLQRVQVNNYEQSNLQLEKWLGQKQVSATHFYDSLFFCRRVPDISKYGNPYEIIILIFYNRPNVASEAARFFYDMLEKYHSHPASFIRKCVKFLYKVEVR